MKTENIIHLNTLYLLILNYQEQRKMYRTLFKKRKRQTKVTQSKSIKLRQLKKKQFFVDIFLNL